MWQLPKGNEAQSSEMVVLPVLHARAARAHQDGTEPRAHDGPVRLCAGEGEVMDEVMIDSLRHEWNTQRHESALSEYVIQIIRCRFCCDDQSSENLTGVCPARLQAALLKAIESCPKIGDAEPSVIAIFSALHKPERGIECLSVEIEKETRQASCTVRMPREMAIEMGLLDE